MNELIKLGKEKERERDGPRTKAAGIIPPCLAGLEGLPLQSWAWASPLSVSISEIQVSLTPELLFYSVPETNTTRSIVVCCFILTDPKTNTYIYLYIIQQRNSYTRSPPGCYYFSLSFFTPRTNIFVGPILWKPTTSSVWGLPSPSPQYYSLFCLKKNIW